jgi:hypothetical protein
MGKSQRCVDMPIQKGAVAQPHEGLDATTSAREGGAAREGPAMNHIDMWKMICLPAPFELLAP